MTSMTYFVVEISFLISMMERRIMNIFLSLFIIFGGGILGGFVFEKIKLPKLVWYIILGILIGPSLLNIVVLLA